MNKEKIAPAGMGDGGRALFSSEWGRVRLHGRGVLCSYLGETTFGNCRGIENVIPSSSLEKKEQRGEGASVEQQSRTLPVMQ